MIEKIITVSDVHIRNLRRMEETSDILTQFIDECKKIVQEYHKDEVRIVIVGDLVNSKIDTSNECNLITAWFLRELNSIAKTIVIAGNHDLLMNNLNRVDALTPLFTMSAFDNCFYLDKDLGFQSGCVVDDNVVWCLFSTFDNFNKPDFELMKVNHPDKTFIGLIHTDIIGSLTDIGKMTETGISAELFKGLDFVCAGHIHKRQEIKKHGVKVVYCGSIIQQNLGENVTGHGYVLWDVPTKTYEFKDIETDIYGYYKFKIKDENDVENNLEKIINY